MSRFSNLKQYFPLAVAGLLTALIISPAIFMVEAKQSIRIADTNLLFQSPLPPPITPPPPPPTPAPPYWPRPSTFESPPPLANDDTPPTTAVELSGVLGKGGWFISPVTVALNATDDMAGVDYTAYLLNSNEVTVYTNSFTVQAEQNHALEYFSVDNIGNIEHLDYSYFKIDRTPPTATHLLVGVLFSNETYLLAVTINFGGADTISGLDHFEFNLDGRGWQTVINSYTVTKPGQHTLTYRAVDQAGNVSAEETIVFTIIYYLVQEAEEFDLTLPRNGQAWPVLTHLNDFGGTGYVTARPDRGVLYSNSPQTTAPELRYDLTLPFTGTYHLWLRGAGADAEGDEVYAALVKAGVMPTTPLTLSGLPPFTWGWSNQDLGGSPITVTVTTTGSHTLYLWPREDGVSVDRILLTDNPEFEPVGVGPD